MEGWCSTFCRDCDYPGNQELIRLGAIPINEEWDGNVEAVPSFIPEILPEEKPEQVSRQLSLFDI